MRIFWFFHIFEFLSFRSANSSEASVDFLQRQIDKMLTIKDAKIPTNKMEKSDKNIYFDLLVYLYSW